MVAVSDADRAHPVHKPSSRGAQLAALGVLGFSFSFPATVWALTGFGPWSATGLRALIASAAAGIALMLTRQARPGRAEWLPLAVVAAGCVLGFPLLTTLALQTSTTSHSAVVIGALPLATAVISTLRTGTPQPWLFWIGAVAGGVVVVGFSLLQSHGRFSWADLFLFGALISAAAGYAEGGRLSASRPGWTVIAWALVLSTPINLLVSVWALSYEPVHLGFTALGGLAYIALISQFIAFIPWYQGMSLIGVAKASQIQLAQPLLTLVWSVLLMGERLTLTAAVTAALVLGCIILTQRARA